MPEVTAVHTGPEGIHAMVSGAVATIVVGSGSGNRRDEPNGRLLRTVARMPHVQTQTYDNSGRLVESAVPPILNFRR